MRPEYLVYLGGVWAWSAKTTRVGPPMGPWGWACPLISGASQAQWIPRVLRWLCLFVFPVVCQPFYQASLRIATLCCGTITCFQHLASWHHKKRHVLESNPPIKNTPKTTGYLDEMCIESSSWWLTWIDKKQADREAETNLEVDGWIEQNRARQVRIELRGHGRIGKTHICWVAWIPADSSSCQGVIHFIQLQLPASWPDLLSIATSTSRGNGAVEAQVPHIIGGLWAWSSMTTPVDPPIGP